MPIETAQEIGAALADYLGDSGMAAPLDVAGMHAEPTVSIHRDALTDAAGEASPDLHEDAADGTAGTRPRGHAAVRACPIGCPSGCRAGHARRRRISRRPRSTARRRQGPDSLRSAAGSAGGARPPAAVRGPAGTAAVRRDRAPRPGRGAGGHGGAVRVGGDHAGHSTGSHSGSGGPVGTDTAARGRLDATSGGTSDTGSGVLAVHRRGRGQERRPHRQGGARLAAHRDRRRPCSSSWSSPWPSRSTAAARTAIRRRPRARTPRSRPTRPAPPIEIAGVQDFDPEGDPAEENPETARNADRRRPRAPPGRR